MQTWRRPWRTICELHDLKGRQRAALQRIRGAVKIGPVIGRSLMSGASRRGLSFTVSAALIGLFAGCATLQAPRVAPRFPLHEMSNASAEGVEVRVRPIRGEDEYLQWFDDDLPAVGIVGVWVEIENTRAQAIGVRPSSWVLRTQGRTYRSLTVSEVYKRYYSMRHVRMYDVETDLEARSNMKRIELSGGPVAAGSRRSGFVFFSIDPRRAPAWDKSATIVAGEFQLDSRSKTSILVLLSHAGA